jgi:hypothetical protein
VKHLVARDENGAVTMAVKCCGDSAVVMRKLHPELAEVDAEEYAAARRQMLVDALPEGQAPPDENHPQLVALRALAAQPSN